MNMVGIGGEGLTESVIYPYLRPITNTICSVLIMYHLVLDPSILVSLVE